MFHSSLKDPQNPHKNLEIDRSNNYLELRLIAHFKRPFPTQKGRNVHEHLNGLGPVITTILNSPLIVPE